MKVCIAIPSLDMVHTEFMMSVAGLLTKRAYDRNLRRDVDIAVRNARGSATPFARNLLVDAAAKASATHILFLDSDMQFPADTLERLLAHKLPIVGANYVRRCAPFDLLGKPDGNGTGQVVPMKTLPFGCILISMKVFDALPKPHFRYVDGVTNDDSQSEDNYFCSVAREHGHTIWCDTALTRDVGHVGTQVYRPC